MSIIRQHRVHEGIRIKRPNSSTTIIVRNINGSKTKPEIELDFQRSYKPTENGSFIEENETARIGRDDDWLRVYGEVYVRIAPRRPYYGVNNHSVILQYHIPPNYRIENIK